MPVPPEAFVGRETQIREIQARGLQPMRAGRSSTLFLEGEYGFGKTSLARYVMGLAVLAPEQDGYGLFTLYVSLGGCSSLAQFAEYVLRAAAMLSGPVERIRDFVSKFVSSTSLFGVVDVNTQALTRTAPDIATPDAMLGFLRNLLAQSGHRGLVLCLDEINGIADQPWFPQFVKSLVESNAVNGRLPLLLMLCGTPDRRRQMIEKHQPVERIWHPLELDIVDHGAIRKYLTRAFSSVGIRVTDEPLQS